MHQAGCPEQGLPAKGLERVKSDHVQWPFLWVTSGGQIEQEFHLVQPNTAGSVRTPARVGRAPVSPGSASGSFPGTFRRTEPMSGNPGLTQRFSTRGCFAPGRHLIITTVRRPGGQGCCTTPEAWRMAPTTESAPAPLSAALR